MEISQPSVLSGNKNSLLSISLDTKKVKTEQNDANFSECYVKLYCMTKRNEFLLQHYPTTIVLLSLSLLL